MPEKVCAWSLVRRAVQVGTWFLWNELLVRHRAGSHREIASRCHDSIVNPQKRSSRHAHGGHGAPNAAGLMSDFSEVMDKHAAEPSADQRADSDWQKGKSHIRALLARRREPRNIFVVARGLRDLAKRN